MDHPFQTQRPTLHRAKEGLVMIEDALMILHANPKDRAHIRERCEGLVTNEALRATLERRAFCLGTLLETIATHCDGLKILPSAEWATSLAPAWRSVLTTDDVDETLKTTLQGMATSLAAVRDAASTEERDSGSSSYSDYSDSETESTESDDEREGSEEDDSDQD